MATPRKVVLRESELETPAEAHAVLARRLGFPDYYGANLDALADCLGEVAVPTRIVLRRSDVCHRDWFDALERVVRATAEASCFVGCTLRYD